MAAAQTKFQIFAYFFREYNWRLIVLYLAQLFNGAAEMLGIAALFPLFTVLTSSGEQQDSRIYKVFEQVFGAIDVPLSLENILLVIVGAFAVKAVLRYCIALYTTHLTSHIILNVRTALLKALLKSRWRFYVQKPVGMFLNALFTEAQSSGGAFRSINDIIATSLQIAALMILAVFASWKIVAVGVACALVLWVSLNRFVTVSGKMGREQRDESKNINSYVADILQNYKPLKAMSVEGAAFDRAEAGVGRLYKISRQLKMAKESLTIFHEPLVVMFICAALYVSIAYASVEPALLMVFIALFYRIIVSYNVLQLRYQTLCSQESFFWSLQDFTKEAEAEEEFYQPGVDHHIGKEIRFEKVGFKYESDDILKDLNMTLPAKKLIGLCGPSGTGKTTIIDLICRLYKPGEGRILVDDVPLEAIDLYLWRQKIGYVPQEFVVFHDTVRNNITLGDKNISEERVIEALKEAEAWPFIKDMSEGLDTVLGERGGRLSGGQRQRIALARALVRKPEILILDEATASLDPETEEEIFKTLKKLAKDMTIIAVSHQEIMIKAADIVIDLGELKKAA